MKRSLIKLPRFELRGWLFGRDLQKIPVENRCKEGYRPAHYSKRLRPMSSLLDLMRERGAPVVEDRYGPDHIEFMRNGGFRLGSQ